MLMYPVPDTAFQAIRDQGLVEFVTHLEQRDWAVVVRVSGVALLFVNRHNSSQLEGGRQCSLAPAAAEQGQQGSEPQRSSQQCSDKFRFDCVRPGAPIWLQAGFRSA